MRTNYLPEYVKDPILSLPVCMHESQVKEYRTGVVLSYNVGIELILFLTHGEILARMIWAIPPMKYLSSLLLLSLGHPQVSERCEDLPTVARMPTGHRVCTTASG